MLVVKETYVIDVRTSWIRILGGFEVCHADEARGDLYSPLQVDPCRIVLAVQDEEGIAILRAGRIVSVSARVFVEIGRLTRRYTVTGIAATASSANEATRLRQVLGREIPADCRRRRAIVRTAPKHLYGGR